jgi:hypothetical protein
MIMNSTRPPKLQAIHDATGNIIGLGAMLPGAALGMPLVASCLVIVDAWIGKNGAIESSKYSGSVCDKCAVDRRLKPRGKGKP